LQVADELESLGRRLDVPFVCSSSETLHPVDKDCLVRAFSGRILEVYGSSEGGNIAFRSESEPWTILEPRVLVEVLDEHRRPVAPGEIGELVITTLTEPTSPLVRYATGDLAQLQSGSAMGASGLRLAALAGRSSDAVVDSRGRRVPFWAVAGPAFWVSDALARHVRRWRIHQSADLSVDVYVELAPGGVLSEIAPAVRHHLQSILGPLPARVTRQNRVHDPVTGKFRAVTSDALVRRDSIDRRS
jgi:phenylacetate-CoA ligase